MDDETLKQIIIGIGILFLAFMWLILPLTLQAIECNTSKTFEELEKIRKLLEKDKNKDVRNP